MKRLCGMVIVMAVALALAAPAAAAGPADGWSGSSWSSVVEGLGGWVDALWRAIAGSETAGDETLGEEDDPVAVSSDDPTTATTTGTGSDSDSAPEFDPNG